MVIAMDGNSEAPIAMDGRLAYTVPEAAEKLRLGERTVWRLVRAKQIESFKVGRARRVSRAALVKYMNRQAAA